MDDRKTILLVEDEALIAIAQKKALEKHGYAVVAAHSGNKAIETVRTTPGIDLILMDINLGKGKMDGTEAAEIILKDHDIPVLFLSSYTQPEIVERTEKITSYGYVVKDSGETVLNASIKMAFKLHEAHRQVQHNAEQFRSITNTSIDGFWLLNMEGQILDVNEAYCVTTGYSRDELLKMSIPDLEAVEDPDMVMEHMHKLIEKGSDRFESSHRCKDGRIIDVEVSTVLTGEQRCLVFIQNITERKRAEDSLRESEEKFRILIETSNEGIWMMNGDHETTFVNRAMAHMMGYEPSEMVGEKVESFFFPEDMGFHAERMTKRHMGQDEVYERRFRRKDGSELWTLVSAKALTDTRAGFAGSFAMFTDITARKLTEKELRESEERFRLVFESANVGKSITLLTGAIFVNKAFCDMLGYTREELKNKRWQDLTPPDEIDPIQKRLDALLCGEKDAVRFDKRYTHKNGSCVWADLSVAVHRDSEEKPLFFITTLSDITGSKRAHELLLASEEKFRKIFYSAPVLLTISDIGSGRYVEVNDAFLDASGFSRDEVIGRSSTDLRWIAREDRERLIAALSTGGRIVGMDLALTAKDGKSVQCLYSGEIVTIDGKEHLLSIALDVTPQKQAEENIKASLREKELLLKEVHHRVKNNLMIVSSLLNLQSGTIRDRKTKGLIEDCRRRIQAMSLIHNRLYRSADLAHISFKEYAGDLLLDIARSYGDRPGNVAIVTEVGDITFDIDTAIPLGLIINELVSNAMKHAFPGERKGTITVSLRQQVTGLRLSVKDDGAGFPEGVDFTATESLGMQLVVTLVEQLDGSIELTSDHGTEFNITLGTEHKV